MVGLLQREGVISRIFVLLTSTMIFPMLGFEAYRRSSFFILASIGSRTFVVKGMIMLIWLVDFIGHDQISLSCLYFNLEASV